MKKPTGLPALFPHDGVAQIDCTMWWIMQIVLDWNQMGYLPTLRNITGKLKEQLEESNLGIYLGSEHNPESVLEKHIKCGLVSARLDRDGKNRYYVTPQGGGALERRWSGIVEGTVEFDCFFLNKDFIPKAKPLGQTG